ncbi:MAG TPA: FAD-dependent oxidoreductase [Acidimicrobiales bacterium]|nr:FAD-dependent oxidoreductase [Acidimicrobiales bacterium]
MADRLVVIGGDAAGMTAAMQARRRQPYLEIVVLERGPWTSYAACGIPYLVGGEVERLEDLVVRSPQQFRDQHRIDVRIRHEAMAIDHDRRQVEVRDHQHQRTIALGYDKLLVATGARPLRPDLPGIDLEHVKGVQTLDDARVLLDHARSRQCRRVVVVGGGYIGLEMAEAFCRWGAEVTIVERQAQLMGTLDPDIAARLVEPMEGLGIEVRLNTAVAGFEPGAVLLDGEERLDADLVVLGLGVTPNAELAADAGVATGARGALSVDRRQRTNLDGVYAAGDCCESWHLVSGRTVHVALGTVANKQGRVAGINLGGGYATFPGVVGTAITRVCSLEVSRTGLTEGEAADAAIDAVAASIDTTTRASYLPDAEPMTVKLIAERGTGRLLGGQIVGGEGAAKRIDTVATALHARLRVDEVVDLDLAYAPPFSSVWDPVAVAARVLEGRL